ncbi:hypothetical protein M0R19_02875 [Candidatus Pacearchaeota archaeon]|jgi:hypothetical protein|nr:hypothetical protein [Candidatus Pacearchaeota archaeon]
MTKKIGKDTYTNENCKKLDNFLNKLDMEEIYNGGIKKIEIDIRNNENAIFFKKVENRLIKHKGKIEKYFKRDINY